MLKIIASMTTLPSRLEQINPSMVSVLDQVSFLEINIPHTCKRTNETYTIPDWLKSMQRVKIFRCEDCGPATKIIDTLKRHKNAYVFIMDDDTIYHKTIIRDLLKVSRQKRAVCVSGIDFINGSYMQATNLPQVMEGFGGILLPPHNYTDFEYFEQVLKNPDCFLGDDVVFSNWLKKHGFELWKTKTAFPLQVQLGLNDPNALHKQNNMAERYYRIIKWLHENNMMYLNIN